MLPWMCQGQSLDSTVASLQADLESALQELAAQRNTIAEAKIPLARELHNLESEVIQMRSEVVEATRATSRAASQLDNLRNDVQLRQDEIDYVTNLLNEYITTLPTSLDVSEQQLYIDQIDEATRALDAPNLATAEQFSLQTGVVNLGLDRALEVIGGSIFAGEAVGPEGRVASGSFVLFGPSSYFSSSDGSVSGMVQRSNSDQPLIIPLPEDGGQIAAFASTGSGTLPVDTTLGKALALSTTNETLGEHIAKGGIWIYPILFAAFVSIFVAIFKAFEIYTLPKVSPLAVHKLIRLIREGKDQEAKHEANQLSGPKGDMLASGVRYAHESKELLEEILLEKIVETQPKVERFLSMIAVTAATAPLLGLLGTVTGMINTFKLITIFGTGDARQLSSGISEALITTEFGLIVAIPAVIAHAFLSRKAKSIMADMETTAMTFVNGISSKTTQDEDEVAEAS